MTAVAPVDDLQARIDARRGAAMRLCDQAAAPRIAAAPPGYVLAHGSVDIARQCGLLTPLPAPREVRVVATPAPSAGAWRLDVATRDRPGLLAAFTGVLAETRLDVVQAVLATWGDGGALEAFVVRAAAPPDTRWLEKALAASLTAGLRPLVVDDADVTFENRHGSPYTACQVRAADRPGLLHAIAVAFAAVAVDVHAARVATVDGVAHDRFDLSDPFGRPLTPALQAAVRHRLGAA